MIINVVIFVMLFLVIVNGSVKKLIFLIKLIMFRVVFYIEVLCFFGDMMISGVFFVI